MDTARQILRFSIPGSIAIALAVLFVGIVTIILGSATINGILDALRNNGSAVIAIVAAIPVGFLLYQVYYLTLQGTVWMILLRPVAGKGRRWVRRDRGGEVLSSLRDSDMRRVVTMFETQRARATELRRYPTLETVDVTRPVDTLLGRYLGVRVLTDEYRRWVFSDRYTRRAARSAADPTSPINPEGSVGESEDWDKDNDPGTSADQLSDDAMAPDRQKEIDTLKSVSKLAAAVIEIADLRSGVERGKIPTSDLTERLDLEAEREAARAKEEPEGETNERDAEESTVDHDEIGTGDGASEWIEESKVTTMRSFYREYNDRWQRNWQVVSSLIELVSTKPQGSVLKAEYVVLSDIYHALGACRTAVELAWLISVFVLIGCAGTNQIACDDWLLRVVGAIAVPLLIAVILFALFHKTRGSTWNSAQQKLELGLNAILRRHEKLLGKIDEPRSEGSNDAGDQGAS